MTFPSTGPTERYAREVRLLKLDPVFDELRGRRRLRLWVRHRVRRSVYEWLVKWNLVKPPRGSYTYGPGTRKRRR